MKSILPIISFLLMYAMCFGQDIKVTDSTKAKRILIYSQGDGYLQPLIVSKIRKLTNTKVGGRYFSAVSSLNNFIDSNRFQETMSDIVSLQRPVGQEISYDYTDSQNKSREEIFDVIIDYDYLLVINTNTLVELIEFQLKLFPVDKSQPKNGGVNSPLIIVDDRTKIENFFINPKELGYKKEVTNAVERLFKDSNKKPYAELLIFEEQVKNGDVVTVPLGKEFSIDASRSGDFDSEFLTYVWRSVPKSKETYQNFDKVDLKKNVVSQTITLREEGKYKILFYLDDGVQNSDTINFTLKTTAVKENLSILYNEIDSYSFGTLINNKHNTLQKGSVYFTQIDGSTVSKDDIIVSTKSLGRKYNPQSHMKYRDTSFTLSKEKILGRYRLDFYSNFEDLDSNVNSKKYIYVKDDKQILSDSIELNHNFTTKTPIYLSLYSMVGGLEETGRALQGSVNQDVATFINVQIMALLELGFYLTRDIEIGLGFPVLSVKNQTVFDKYEFNYPSGLYVYGNYTFPLKGKIIPRVGLSYKGYEYYVKEKNIHLSEVNPNLSPDKIYTFGFSPRISIVYPLFYSTAGLIDIQIRAEYDSFLSSEFSNLGAFLMGVGVSARF